MTTKNTSLAMTRIRAALKHGLGATSRDVVVRQGQSSSMGRAIIVEFRPSTFTRSQVDFAIRPVVEDRALNQRIEVRALPPKSRFWEASPYTLTSEITQATWLQLRKAEDRASTKAEADKFARAAQKIEALDKRVFRLQKEFQKTLIEAFRR